MQIITDTLSYNLPFAENKAAAQARPNPEAAKEFCEILQSELSPWTERFGNSLSVHTIQSRSTSPWMGFVLQTDESASETAVVKDWEALLAVADASAATEMMKTAKPAIAPAAITAVGLGTG